MFMFSDCYNMFPYEPDLKVASAFSPSFIVLLLFLLNSTEYVLQTSRFMATQAWGV
jgi:hypothetical protein